MPSSMQPTLTERDLAQKILVQDNSTDKKNTHEQGLISLLATTEKQYSNSKALPDSRNVYNSLRQSEEILKVKNRLSL